jgi:hypothetical protein
MLSDYLAHFLARLVDGIFFPGRLLVRAAAPKLDPELGLRIRHVAAFSQILATRPQAKNMVAFFNSSSFRSSPQLCSQSPKYSKVLINFNFLLRSFVNN